MLQASGFNHLHNIGESGYTIFNYPDFSS